MADWENLRHFLAVARAGTLSGAARALHVDHATVSRRVAALEAELNVPLVERLPRSCRITAAGMQVFEQARLMEGAAFAIERQSQARQTTLLGRVTLSASPVLTSFFLAPRMADFQARYPGIQLSVTAEARQISLSRGEADIALRHARPTDASNVARRIGRMPFALYASRDYPVLATPDHWRFIAYDERFASMPQQHWLLGMAGGRAVGCELSDIGSHLVAVRSGAGVAGLPCFLGDAHADLVRLDHGESGFSRDIWLVTHRDLKRSTTVRAVMDYLAESFENEPGLGIR
ncbi:LysR family transcriptional regulator [Paraburkholderia caballeronis]|uniref:DNA-binding transcriptional regulator, LysR family n=1 Tax=Paraburkholderia caballeronis TaxID=416943 RepID=A0A1H7U9I0_9BURK|nr:LysR family transcriptional regulator [Paraburkholderia caballeronis]PXW23322.1 LysR family transcriptional regulator [Paraburkholderia caballeronis]PXW98315.1 LysR family transcriptional regulator [Paraburkholderia caballeronis]RAJ95045.1 LysR family transcriptional regulator [Paraburkholderia caballeronis]SEC59956.1 transcriptional regulator, LysR family [Paraburkholderia caballeronis]SEL93601.1 DNA-binding transcriptional regulator, LysR family [Paraburkholderia caballeronis]